NRVCDARKTLSTIADFGSRIADLKRLFSPQSVSPKFAIRNPQFMPRGVHRFAVLVASATFFLIIAGANVTSHDAGLATSDWPLSNGQLFPKMVGNLFWEHGHRMVATIVGLLTIVLAVVLQWREPRRWVKRLGWLALAAVIAQGLLGGLTVKMNLPLA